MINSVCADWTSSRSKFLCEQLLQERGVAAVAVRTLPEIKETNQYRARNFLLPDDGGTLRTELLPALSIPTAPVGYRGAATKPA